MKVRGQTILNPRERIMSMSVPEPNSGCWIWLGGVAINQRGLAYGRIGVGSRGDKTRTTWGAHRYSYYVVRSDIPSGVHVCHVCDNTLCVCATPSKPSATAPPPRSPHCGRRWRG